MLKPSQKQNSEAAAKAIAKAKANAESTATAAATAKAKADTDATSAKVKADDEAEAKAKAKAEADAAIAAKSKAEADAATAAKSKADADAAAAAAAKAQAEADAATAAKVKAEADAAKAKSDADAVAAAKAKSDADAAAAAKAKADADAAAAAKAKSDADVAAAKSKADADAATEAATAAKAKAPSAAWIDLSSHASPISFDYWKGDALHTASVFFSPTPADEILYYNDNLTPQDPISIGGYIDTQLFGIGSHTLTYVSGCDEPTSLCTNATGGGQNGEFSNTFLSTMPFNFLAVHFGQGELVFQWDNPITSFEIGGLPRGLSNYRAYTDQPPPVPEPEIYAMLLAGLGLLGFSVRRRKL